MTFEDIVQIQQLVCREREARDRQWWDEMRQVYSSDAQISISWYQGSRDGFIEGSIRMAQQGGRANHRLRPVVVRVNGDKAVATLSAAIETRTAVNGIEADLDSQSRLIYQATRTEQNGEGGIGWKLCSLTCIYQRDTLTPAIPGQTLVVETEQMKAFRASYRCLSYVLENKGIVVNHDLPGDDRPEQVAALYDDVFRWLGASPRL